MRIVPDVPSGAHRAATKEWKPLFRPDWVPQIVDLLRDHGHLYVLLDAARDPHVQGLLIVEELAYRSLYEGAQGEELADFAPYLLELPCEASLLDVLVRDGWGKSWGVFLTSAEPFDAVRRHFRRFLLVEAPDGEEVLFRFYDPRVLRVFLPHCNAEEARSFFGPVASFLVEGETAGELLRFTPVAKGVSLETISFGPCVDALPDLPWVKPILEGFTDLHEDERLDLLRGWSDAVRR